MLFKRAKLKREEEIRQLKADAAKKAGFAFLAGSLIAAVVTLFTAPKSGKEMRADVAEKVECGADKLKEKGEYLVIKTAEVMDATLEKGKQVKNKFIKKNELQETPVETIVEEELFLDDVESQEQ